MCCRCALCYQDIKTSVCQCEDAISELYQRAQQVAPLVIGSDRQPRQHVSAATLCSYRPLNVRLALVSVYFDASAILPARSFAFSALLLNRCVCVCVCVCFTS